MRAYLLDRPNRKPLNWALLRREQDFRLWLVAILAAALLLRLAIALLHPAIAHPDEIFQYWEQAYRVVFGQGIVPWEYRDGLRSWVLPGFLAGIIATIDRLGGGWTAWHTGVVLILSLGSLSVVVTAALWARRLAGTAAALLAAFGTAVWFELAYFAAKPLTEAVATATLFPAAYLLCAIPAPPIGRLLAGGALLGLTFVLRFHLSPAILVVALFAMASSPWPRFLVPAIPAAVVVVAAGLLDWVTWDYPFQSIWFNFYVNAVQGKSAHYGVGPWYWYAELYWDLWRYMLVPVIACALIGARRSPVLLVVPLAIVVSHSLIAHKEHRYLLPALPFLLTLAAVGCIDFLERIVPAIAPRLRRIVFAGLCSAVLVASVALGVMATPKGSAHQAASDVNNNAVRNGVNSNDVIRIFRAVGNVEMVCGLGVAGIPWHETAGYTHYARDTPMYFLDGSQAPQAQSKSFNALVFRLGDEAEFSPQYETDQCIGSLCFAIRAGGCVDDPQASVNAMIERRGQ